MSKIKDFNMVAIVTDVLSYCSMVTTVTHTSSCAQSVHVKLLRGHSYTLKSKMEPSTSFQSVTVMSPETEYLF